MTKQRFGLAILFGSWATTAWAASLAGGLGVPDINQAVKVFGTGTSIRLLRSAESSPLWPGIKFGIEVTLLPTRDLNTLGAANGTLPPFYPVPRLYVAKGLGHGFEAVLGTFPISGQNNIATFGALLKWTAHSENDSWLSTAFYAGYTRMLALNSTLRAHTWEIGATLSKDFVRVRPYGGVALALLSGDVDSSLASGIATSDTLTNVKLSLGVEIELPLNVAFQLDFVDFIPAPSVFLGAKF